MTQEKEKTTKIADLPLGDYVLLGLSRDTIGTVNIRYVKNRSDPSKPIVAVTDAPKDKPRYDDIPFMKWKNERGKIITTYCY